MARQIFKRVSVEPRGKEVFARTHVEWRLNLENARLVFEHMVKSAKHCLNKVIGRNCLTYDELLMLATKVKVVTPFTYISLEDVEEPLMPLHLLYLISRLQDHDIA